MELPTGSAVSRHKKLTYHQIYKNPYPLYYPPENWRMFFFNFFCCCQSYLNKLLVATFLCSALAYYGVALGGGAAAVVPVYPGRFTEKFLQSEILLSTSIAPLAPLNFS